MHHRVHNDDHTPASEEEMYQLFRNKKEKEKIRYAVHQFHTLSQKKMKWRRLMYDILRTVWLNQL